MNKEQFHKELAEALSDHPYRKDEDVHDEEEKGWNKKMNAVADQIKSGDLVPTDEEIENAVSGDMWFQGNLLAALFDDDIEIIVGEQKCK